MALTPAGSVAFVSNCYDAKLSDRDVVQYSGEHTLSLSELDVKDVMTGNNGAHQHSPDDPGIQKSPSLSCPTPRKKYFSEICHLRTSCISSIEIRTIIFLGVGPRIKTISESLGRREKHCFRSWQLTLNFDGSNVSMKTKIHEDSVNTLYTTEYLFQASLII